MSLGMLHASDVEFVGNAATVSQSLPMPMPQPTQAVAGAIRNPGALVCVAIISCLADVWWRGGRGGCERGGAWWRVPLQQGLGRWARAWGVQWRGAEAGACCVVHVVWCGTEGRRGVRVAERVGGRGGGWQHGGRVGAGAGQQLQPQPGGRAVGRAGLRLGRGRLTGGVCVVCVGVWQAGSVEGRDEAGGAGGGAVAAEGASLVLVGSRFWGNSIVGVSGAGAGAWGQGWCRPAG